MANFSLLMLLVAVILVGSVFVEGWSHGGKGNGKTAAGKNAKVRRSNMLEDELTNWKKREMEKEELLELREASGDADSDSDDTDESGESDESPEDEEEGIEISVET